MYQDDMEEYYFDNENNNKIIKCLRNEEGEMIYCSEEEINECSTFDPIENQCQSKENL